MKNIIRVPRPKGLTEMCHNLNTQSHPQQKKKLKDSIINTIIKDYITNGLSLSGSITNLSTLSTLLEISEKELYKRLLKYTSIPRFAYDPTDIATVRGLQTNLLIMGLMDRGLILEQVQNLRLSQSGGYKPFITSEYNKILNTLLSSTKPLLDVLKLASPTTSVNIQNNQVVAGDNKYLSTEEAVYLLNKGDVPNLLEDQNQQSLLLEAHHIQEGPEVVATNQLGFKLDAEAVGDLKALSGPKPRRKTNIDTIE